MHLFCLMKCVALASNALAFKKLFSQNLSFGNASNVFRDFVLRKTCPYTMLSLQGLVLTPIYLYKDLSLQCVVRTRTYKYLQQVVLTRTFPYTKLSLHHEMTSCVRCVCSLHHSSRPVPTTLGTV